MSEIRKLVNSLVNNGNDKVESFLATVKSVDKEKRICDVMPSEGAELFDVKLCAAQLKQTNGFWVVPKVGSDVLVTMLGTDAGFISMVSEVDEIYLQTSETDNGGLIKIEYLMQRLNSIENELNKHSNLLKTHIHPPNAISPTLVGLVSVGVTNRNSLENKKVIH